VEGAVSDTSSGHNGQAPDEPGPDAPASEVPDELELCAEALDSQVAANGALRERLEDLQRRNQQLAVTLGEARDSIAQLRDELDRLTAGPNPYGVWMGRNDDGTADVTVHGRRLRVAVSTELDREPLLGDEVVLSETMAVIAVAARWGMGEIVVVEEVLGDGRALVSGRGDDSAVCIIAAALAGQALRVGDHVLCDARTGLLYEKVERPEVGDLVLEEVPDVGYDQIGGLAEQIEVIRDAVELPYTHAELFAQHELAAPKGILLYGPPGCGKTLIAKAVANSLARRVAERTGDGDVRAWFMNIKGPELLNKWVGETERRIRLIFERAREKAAEGCPVVVFFDEMDSLFRTRGSGVSSDMESTVVPQLLAEIDGVEALRNVIVIGASNREDLIDPAILRPGRLDVKIKVSRPDRDAAGEIFRTYLHDTLPLDRELVAAHGRRGAVDELVGAAVEEMYSTGERNRFIEVTYQGGSKEELHFADFASGAMVENVVRRAKKLSVKRAIDGGEAGITCADMVASVRQEFREHEDLPNTSNPDDWAKVSGRKGERIVYLRTLVHRGVDGDEDGRGGGRQIDTVSAGQYL